MAFSGTPGVLSGRFLLKPSKRTILARQVPAPPPPALHRSGEAITGIPAADLPRVGRTVLRAPTALVIVDIVMPEKDGIETVREILAIDPAAVIFTMSGAEEDYQEVARLVEARRVPS